MTWISVIIAVVMRKITLVNEKIKKQKLICVKFEYIFVYQVYHELVKSDKFIPLIAAETAH